MSTEATNRILTLPNIISVIRLLLVPIFAIMLVVYENNVAAFILFLVAASTDFLDGAIARATSQVTRLGQQLDPLVDRVLILTAVILIYLVGRTPLWVLLLIVARDLSMLVLIWQLRSEGMPKLRVAFVGKAATAVIMAGFCLLILNWPEVPGLGLIIDSKMLPGWGSAPAPLGIWLVYVGVGLAWAAGIYYMLRAYQDYERLRNGSSDHRGRGQAGWVGQADAGPARAHQGEGAASFQSASNSRGASGLNDTASFHNAFVYSSGKRPELTTANSRTPRQRTATRRAQHGNANPSGRQDARLLGKFDSQLGNGLGGARSKGGVSVPSILNTPKRVAIALAVTLALVLAIAFYVYDGVSNYGVIHSGVRVGTLDVGHMQREEAATLIAEELAAAADAAPVYLFASEEAMAAGIDDTTLDVGHGVLAYNQEEVNPDATSWSTTPSTFGATVDGERLAEEAYEVGRKGDFLLGRLAATLLGVTVTPQIDFSQDRVTGLEGLLTATIGTPMKNADIVFDGSRFTAEDGHDGYVVDDERFREELQAAFTSDEREFIVPMIDRKMQVTLEDAREVADATLLSIEESVIVSFEGESWTLTTEDMGQYISTSVEEDERGEAQLVASFDPGLLESRLPEVTGVIEDPVPALDAEFVEVDGNLQLNPSQSGTGVDYPRLADDLNAVVFGGAGADADSGSAADRSVSLQIGALEPDLTTSEAESYDFATKITEYTIEYWWVPEGTITNIHVASDLINSSIIEPGGTWSFNETAGECTAEKGFVTAQIILGDEYVDEVGGGICSVASTVFNTAYEAGYPIVERANHSLRLSRYPLGRDAAIAYPYIDLKFKNDTENYLLLTMSYTDYSVTCTLWGVPPGYRVESETGELVEGKDFTKKEEVDESLEPGESYVEQEGKKACKVEVTRTVYDASGNLKEQRTFHSSYDPTPEITRVASESASAS